MNYIDINKESYNKIAELFSSTRGYTWGDINVLKKYVKSGNKVLDLGCGNGRLVESLKKLNVEYLGVDNSKGLISEAKTTYPDYKFQVGDMRSVEGSQFDVIFMISSFNHFPKEKQQAVINNVKKLLKPGGKLLMVNWNLWNRANPKSIWKNLSLQNILLGNRDVVTHWKTTGVDVPLYYYAFTKGEVKRLLKRSGFKVIENYYSAKNDPENPGQASSWLRGLNIVTIAIKK